jgi:acetoin utilization deacetylase AcuC-like enzyme
MRTSSEPVRHISCSSLPLFAMRRGTFYPGTGGATEVGRGDGEGFTVNVPWDTDGVSDGDYMAAMQQVRTALS